MLNRNHLILFLIFLAVFDFLVWKSIILNKPNSDTELYFLDVGQGDSELVILPGGVKILIDAGPNSKIVSELESVLRSTDRYIDLLVLSRPETDHFNGFIDVLKRYQVGAFIYNGRAGAAQSWKELAKIVEENKVPVFVLGQGDKIKNQDDFFEILLPNADFLRSKELNDTSLTMKLINNDEQNQIKVLFTGDIGEKNEKYLVSNFDIKADILKVGHHGSKYSSSDYFLKAVNPKISAIEVGKNYYGHPTKEVLERLALVGSQIFRTDQNNIIKLAIKGNEINIFKKR
jgi:competence protein ComEC